MNGLMEDRDIVWERAAMFAAIAAAQSTVVLMLRVMHQSMPYATGSPPDVLQTPDIVVKLLNIMSMLVELGPH